RVVDELEERYGSFTGLNLTFEAREGILKHCSLENARKLGELGLRFFPRRQPSVGAQIANLAGESAYHKQHGDDGLRPCLLRLGQLDDLALFVRHADAVRKLFPALSERRTIHETIRRMINTLIIDLIQESTRRIEAAAPTSIDDVRAAPPLVAFSAAMRS